MKKLLSSLLAASIVLQCGAVSSLAAYKGDTEEKTTLCSINFSEKNELDKWTVVNTNHGYPDNTPVLAVCADSVQDMVAPYLTVTNPTTGMANTFTATRTFDKPEEMGVVRTKFKYSNDHGNSNATISITDDDGYGIVFGSSFWTGGGSEYTLDGELQKSYGNEANRAYIYTKSESSSSAAYAIGNTYTFDLGANGWGKMWRNVEIAANTSDGEISTTIAGNDITLGKGVYAVAYSDTLGNNTTTNIFRGYMPEMGAFSKFTISTQAWIGNGVQTRIDDLSVELEPAKYVTADEFENWKGVVWGDFAYSIDESAASKIIPSDVSDMVNLGVGWTRIFVGAGYDSKMIEKLVRTASDKGIKVLMTYIKKDGQATYGTEEEEAEEKAYLSALVNKYKGVTSYWEIGNELNLIWLDSGKDVSKLENYAKHLRDCYTTIKAADADATVILGGLSEYYATDWVKAFSDISVDGKPAYKYFDEAAFHPYADTAAQAIRKVNTFKETVETYWGGMPIWITEIGFHAMAEWDYNQAPGKVTSEELKAEYLTTVMNGIHESLSDIQRPVIWYNLHEKGSANGYGLITVTAEEYGVSKTKLAAYTAMKALKPEKVNAKELPIDDTFDEDSGTVPSGWTVNIENGSESEGSVGVTEGTLSGHTGYLSVKKTNTNSQWIVKAIRSFDIPSTGGLINIKFDYIAQGDKKGYGKSIVIKNGDKTGIEITHTWADNKNAVVVSALGGSEDQSSKVIGEEVEEWRTFDITVNCSDTALSGIQPGEYTLSYNGTTYNGKLQNDLTSLDTIEFTSGVYVASSIGVDSLSITEKAVPTVLEISEAYAESGNAEITFMNTKASISADVCVAAYKDDALNRIVKIQEDFIIPKGNPTLKVPLGNTESGEKYKVFVWTSMDKMVPVMKSVGF